MEHPPPSLLRRLQCALICCLICDFISLGWAQATLCMSRIETVPVLLSKKSADRNPKLGSLHKGRERTLFEAAVGRPMFHDESECKTAHILPDGNALRSTSQAGLAARRFSGHPETSVKPSQELDALTSVIISHERWIVGDSPIDHRHSVECKISEESDDSNETIKSPCGLVKYRPLHLSNMYGWRIRSTVGTPSWKNLHIPFNKDGDARLTPHLQQIFWLGSVQLRTLHEEQVSTS
ncbi:hypothetical protein BJX68DRAFT_85249 [Aspergillus pseudodeflectus]|uniref:HNH nuclease domain-containing protein n=1 Tax=Aspergillus pseudodeflectus TaxID=176178 RepID=A0ABR4L7C5_9EURO